MKRSIMYLMACLLLCGGLLKTFAQNGADILIDKGPCDPIVLLLCPSGVVNASYAVDDDLNTYATMKTNLGILSSSYLKMGFSTPAPGGSMVAVFTGSDVALNVDVLASISMQLYDAGGNVIAEKSDLQLADIEITEDNKGLVKLKVPKSKSASSVKLTLGGLVSLNNHLDVYGATHAPAAQSVAADYVYASGPCDPIVPLSCPSGVIHSGYAVDASQNNFAVLSIPLGITAAAWLDLGFSTPGAPGNTVSFVCGSNSTLLGLSLYQNLKVQVFNSAGVLIASKNGFSLAEVELIGSDKFKIKVHVPHVAGNDIAHARITLKAAVGVLSEVRVYAATNQADINFADYFRQAIPGSSINDELVVYPNPAGDHLVITNNEKIFPSRISVYTADGKLAMYTTAGEEENIALDLSSLQEGFYIITVQQNDLIRRSTFVISR